jgi:hypothetical protein
MAASVSFFNVCVDEVDDVVDDILLRVMILG